MTEVAHKMEEANEGHARERRDIVSGTVMPDSRLIRFVADPDGQVVPDVGAKLPGRGLWVESSRDAVNKAVEKKLFSRAAKAQVTAGADLSARAEIQTGNRCQLIDSDQIRALVSISIRRPSSVFCFLSR